MITESNDKKNFIAHEYQSIRELKKSSKLLVASNVEQSSVLLVAQKIFAFTSIFFLLLNATAMQSIPNRQSKVGSRTFVYVSPVSRNVIYKLTNDDPGVN